MTWFKENKFLGGLIVITVILAGVIISLGMKLQETLDEKISEVETEENALKEMKGLNPYPTPKSAKAKTDSLKALIGDANKMQAKFLTFKPESTAPIPVNEFSALLKDTDARVRELFEGKITLPETFYLGFEDYKSELPRPEATGELAYELRAIEWLMGQLAAANATDVGGIVRHEIPSEKGESWDGAAAPARGRKPSRGRSAAVRRGPSLPKIANRMPLELLFKGPESALRDVLTAMADSDQYFFDLRIARIKNESPIPTKPRDAVAASADAPKSDEGFGNLDGGGAEEEAPVAARTKILDRIAGGDDITAYLRADLLLFSDGQQFPATK
ncbi:Amuc_1100 family pilus-like protein [Akkermansiaceae bacterium]|nr:hypothetical protein [Verrucomicrobiaceae bacterium]MDB4753772.1 Amuc_1100 family pilus-like protein [Akkermansiaceae bacterium]